MTIEIKHKNGMMVIDPACFLPLGTKKQMENFLSKVDEAENSDKILNEIMQVLRKKESWLASMGIEPKFVRMNIDVMHKRYGGSWE